MTHCEPLNPLWALTDIRPLKIIRRLQNPPQTTLYDICRNYKGSPGAILKKLPSKKCLVMTMDEIKVQI